MKSACLSWPQLNMSAIVEGCHSLRKTSLMSLVGNHWAAGRLRVNSSSVKEKLISFPLFLLEETAILPMSAMAGCATSGILTLNRSLHSTPFQNQRLK